MLNLTWIKNPDHVSYCKENEVLPRLARELGIADLAQQVEEFRTHPTAEGVNLKGKKRTTLKLFIPNLTFPEPVEMGENVWIYMGDLCPGYCLYTPWEAVRRPNEADKREIIAAVAVIAVLAGAFLVWRQRARSSGLDGAGAGEQRSAGGRAARLRSGGIHSAYRDTWRGGGKPPADGER
mgnify:CR=1 FL=1